MNDNKPIFTLRDRALSASCFMKTYTREDGREVSLFSICLQRSYKKKGDDEYTREKINLMPDDLLKLARLCADAYGEVLKAAMANRPANRNIRRRKWPYPMTTSRFKE